MVIKSAEIEPIKYKGSVAEFRGWMDKFLAHGSGMTIFPDMTQDEKKEMIKLAFEENKGRKGDIVNFNVYYPRLDITYSPKDKDTNREVWYALFYDPKISRVVYVKDKWATILAVEQPPNNTTVQFLDGIYFRLHKMDGRTIDYALGYPLGDAFSKYVQFIKDNWESQYKTSEQTKQAEELSKDELEKALAEIPSEKWRKAVMLWREGKTAPEIAGIINREARTVTNKMTELRRQLTTKIIPYHKEES